MEFCSNEVVPSSFVDNSASICVDISAMMYVVTVATSLACAESSALR